MFNVRWLHRAMSSRPAAVGGWNDMKQKTLTAPPIRVSDLANAALHSRLSSMWQAMCCTLWRSCTTRCRCCWGGASWGARGRRRRSIADSSPIVSQRLYHIFAVLLAYLIALYNICANCLGVTIDLFEHLCIVL